MQRNQSYSAALKYSGIGFIWAWVYCSYDTSLLYPDRAGNAINADASWLISSTVVTLTLFAGGIVLRDLGRSPRGLKALRTIALTAGMLSAAGTCLSWLAGPAGAGWTAALLSGVLTGLGTGTLLLIWFFALTRINIQDGEVAVCVSSALPMIASMGSPILEHALGGLPGALLVVSLPLVSGVQLCACLRDPVSSDVALGEPPVHPPSAVLRSFSRVMLVVAVAYVLICCIGTFSGPVDAVTEAVGFDVSAFLGQVSGIAMLVLFLQFSPKTDFTAVFRLISPLLVCSMALCPWDEALPNALGETIVVLIDCVLQAMSIICVIVLVKQGGLKATVAAGFCQGTIQLGVLVGNTLGSRAGLLIQTGELNIFVLILSLVCLFVAAVSLLPRGEVVPTTDADGASCSQSAACSQTAVRSKAENAIPETRDRLQQDSRSQSVSSPQVTVEARKAGSMQECSDPLSTSDPQAVSGPGRFDGESVQTGGGIQSLESDKFFGACQKLAQAHGLSSRETEILVYLAHGRTQPYIREQLFLSKNTVATHVKHVYQKLSVHSKQELIDLVESRTRTKD